MIAGRNESAPVTNVLAASTTRAKVARRVTLVLAAVAAIGQVSTTIYLPSIPELSRSLGVAESTVQLTIVAYLVPFALFQLIAGPIADSRGRRVTLGVGMGLFIAGSLLGAFSWHVAVLFLGRVLQGIGASAGYTVSRAVARDLFEGAHLTRVIGDIALAFALAPGFMPAVGGFANDFLGWRANFGIPAALGLAIVGAVRVFLPETLRSRTPFQAARLARAYAPIARSTRFISFALLSTAPFIGLFAFFAAGPAYTINVIGLTPREFGVLPPIAVCGFLVGLMLSRRMLRSPRAGWTVSLGIGVGLLAAALVFALYRLELLGAAALTACMFTHATGMGIVVPVTTAEAIRPPPGTRIGGTIRFLPPEAGRPWTLSLALLAALYAGGVLAGLPLVLLAPRFASRAALRLRQSWPRTLLAGLAAALAVPAMLLVLLSWTVTVPLGLGIAAAWIFAAALSGPLCAIALGGSLLRLPQAESPAAGFVALAIGMAPVVLVSSVPGAGLTIALLVVVLGTGTLIGLLRPARPTPPAPPPLP